jgi:nucleotide-binding universal stress UspA family protein
VTLPAADRVVRQGHILPSIAQEVRDWGADLLIVGSHGKGWIQSRVLGSTTEALLNDLPTSLLIVPLASAPAAQLVEPYHSASKA